MIRAAVAATALAAGAGCVDDGGPWLDAAQPMAAPRGATVRLAGRRLCGAAARCEAAGGAVRIGAEPPVVQASVLAYADTEAEIEIPDLAPVGPTVLIVTVNDPTGLRPAPRAEPAGSPPRDSLTLIERASNALAFEVLP